MQRNLFTISKLAKVANVNIQTIRYYERRRLVSPRGRSSSGYRFYTDTELKQVLFIKNAQELGFTLKEIHELLTLRAKAPQTCSNVQRKAEEKLRSIQGKMETLKKLETMLRNLVSDCQKKRPASSCPIIERMEAI